MLNIQYFILCLVITTTYGVDGMRNTLIEDLELERELKLINKPPVKSILQTKFGHVVDCIDINKQPAFDHPLLKNHKLQRPSFDKTIEKDGLKNSVFEPIFGHERIRCPKGTVPIRRTTKDDLIRIKSLSNNHILIQDRPGDQRAEINLEAMNENKYNQYYGVSGTTSIYNPRVKNDQISAAEIWVQNGEPDEKINTITAGWHVYPGLYGDDRTYIYSAWSSDNFATTGCYNMMCPGFVQTDKEFYFGIPIVNISIYDDSVVEVNITIAKDPNTFDWVMIIQNTTVGYFPNALFSNLSSADVVGWGGRTFTSPGTPSPTMGSGHFPDLDASHASYFRKITYLNIQGRAKQPKSHLMNTIITDQTGTCYNIKYYGFRLFQFGAFLQFGGPGGLNCGNGN